MAENRTRSGRRHTAGAFDVRTFVAALMGIYGVVLVLAGLFGPERTADSSTDGHVVNLWVGVVLLVFAAIMQGWAMWRPTVVDEEQLEHDKAEAQDGPPAH